MDSNLKFEVSYTLPYRHYVTVGITARSAAAAKKAARAAFENQTLWDDTPAMPLLQDWFEEDGDGGEALVFESREVSDFVVQSCVREARRQALMQRACEALVAAYARAVQGQSVEWEEVDAAYALALEACPPTHQSIPPDLSAQARRAALNVLEDFNDLETVEELYDVHSAFREALCTLIPDFEYPDWAHCTVADVKARIKRDRA